MKLILAKKLKMTQKFDEDGQVIPVTMVQAGPCVVTQIKNLEKDGYEAIQLGFGLAKKMKKPQVGHTKDLEKLAIFREFSVKKGDQIGETKRGDKITVADFNKGDIVQVIGEAKGKGFQGVVKRHHFHGHPKTHGHKDQLRMPGSIGDTDPGRVKKGKKMAGHMGTQQVTVKNLPVVDIDQANNLLYIKGALPGAINSLLEIKVIKEVKAEKK
jgi:large subunit ribosomal protein L3